MYNFEPYNVLLAIATIYLVLLMTSFVLQGQNIKSANTILRLLLDSIIAIFKLFIKLTLNVI